MTSFTYSFDLFYIIPLQNTQMVYTIFRRKDYDNMVWFGLIHYSAFSAAKAM